MNNTTVNSIDLTGYLTYGHFNVNDYVLMLGRGTQADGRSGMVLSVHDSDGNLLTREMCYDGEPGMTEAEVNAVKELFDKMQEALPEWQSAEEARAAAEKLRNIAEFGEDGEGEGTGNRQGLYKLMLELYNRLYPKIDKDLEAAKEAREKAEQAAKEARAVLENAREISGFDKIEDMLFYKNGDTVSFVDDDDDTTKIVISDYNQSKALNATGYVTGSKKSIRIKIPLKKFLDNIAYVKWESFDANICNSGGYGMSSKYEEKGYDYSGYIQQTIIDKVQNCIHVILRKETGFVLTNNASVNCRCKNVSFTLYDSETSVPEEGASE